MYICVSLVFSSAVLCWISLVPFTFSLICINSMSGE